MRDYWDDIETRWAGWDSLSLGLGQWVREKLTEILGSDFLSAHHATLHAMNSTTQDHYVECWLRKDEDVWAEKYYLQHGYFRGVGMGWCLTGQAKDKSWFHEYIHEDELSQQWLEQQFTR